MPSSASSGSGSSSSSGGGVGTVFAPLRLLARTASKMPIEVITLGFCIVTLAYFQLLHAVKHSEFLHHPSAAGGAGAAASSSDHLAGEDIAGGADPSTLAAEAGTLLARTATGSWVEVPAGHSSEAVTLVLHRVVAGVDLDHEAIYPYHHQAAAQDDRNILAFPAHSSSPVTLADEITPDSLPTSGKAPRALLANSEQANASLRDFEDYLRSSALSAGDGSHQRRLTEVCYKPPTTSIFAASECFTVSFDTTASVDGNSALLSFGLLPTPEAQDWIQSLVAKQPVASSDARGYSYVSMSSLQSRPVADSGLGLSFKAFPAGTSGLANASSMSGSYGEEETKSVRWMLYAARAFVMRFYALAKKADSADIFVMLIGYLLMHLTFINTFINMRKLGSKFWLGCSVLVSGTFGFLLALFTASMIGIAINPIILSEALPFLIITVGFEKPFILARAVFTNPALTPVTKDAHPLLKSRVASRSTLFPSSATNKRVSAFGPHPDSSNGDDSTASVPMAAVRSNGIRWSQPVPAKDIVLQGFDKTGRQIVRDYLIEIAVLIAGSFTGVPGLKEFCQLAALILFFDCVFLFGFFASVMTVMVEVRRIRIVRGLRRVDSSADLAHILDDGTTPDLNAPVDDTDTDALTPKQRITRLLFGAPAGENGESPTARLKILLIGAFLILHALNLCTTLTAKTAITRHSAATTTTSPAISASSFYSQFVSTDPVNSAIAPVLAKLSAMHPSYEIPLVVQVPPPTVFRMVLPGQSVRDITTRAAAALADRSTVAGSMAILDRFMSGWTKLVGDPVLSKWIVIVLVVSVFLNGYLLKGIAVGDTGVGEGYMPTSAPEAATRLLLGTSGKAETAMSRMKRRWSGGVEGLSRMQTEWTLADAAVMAKERRKDLIKDEKDRDAAALLAAKAKKSRKPSSSAGSSDESTAGSPLFMSTKKRTAPYPTGRLVSANEKTPVVPAILTPSSDLANGKQLGHSETSSEAATDTPATTVLDETDSETPTVGRDTKIVRALEEIATVFAMGKGAELVNDEEIILLVQKGKVAAYALEKLLKDHLRAVKIRRALISRASITKSLEQSLLPYHHYDYSKVIGQCCENVVGYTPIPIGIAGPLRIDGVAYPLPMATTEGALVASTSRGCKALNAGGGVTTVVTQDAMTRGPALEFPSAAMCGAAKKWIDSEEGSTIMKAAFNSTSRFARLQSLKAGLAGRTLYVRFATQTGDAMGMNMISKGTERALETMQTDHFPEMKVVALSGNYCTDKKPAAINWIEGRGKSVVAEGIVPGNIVKTILKTTVKDLVKVNISKNLVGSAMAGTMGGNNAHAANNLAAIYLATGQDPAQVVESANCITLMEAINDGQDLLISCTMPSIEVGTIGGGTILPPQLAMLTMLGVNGPHPTHPGENARRLAQIICAAVLAGELSLMSSLAEGSLVRSHMALNRSAPATPATVQVTGHSYLTPAPTRPGTPGPGQPIARQPSNLHLTPMSRQT